MLHTFAQFMTNSSLRNAYVKEEGFKSLYIRKGRYGVDIGNGTQIFSPTIQIARIIAKNPGRGTFTKFIKTLLESYPVYTIIVECVHEQRFQEGLIRLGFKESIDPPNIYVLVTNAVDTK